MTPSSSVIFSVSRAVLRIARPGSESVLNSTLGQVFFTTT